VGIPDAHLTEMVAACIQLRENWQWSEQLIVSNEEFKLSRKNLQLHCIENHLSRYFSKIHVCKRIVWLKEASDDFFLFSFQV